MALTEELWRANLDIYRAILRHPFLRELAEGRLDREAFAFYVKQDSLYLREFARSLNLTAAKAPRPEWGELLSTHAASALQYEKALHQSIFGQYGISAGEVEAFVPSPEAFAYTSFMVASCYGGSFAEALATLLPCYWIYWEVGLELKKQGSSDPVYQKWIDAYASQEYGDLVKAVRAVLDETGGGASPEQKAGMNELFRRSARYEWMFWDSAYRKGSWPIW
jgi:thiaminase (transcriptional activator TenA)